MADDKRVAAICPNCGNMRGVPAPSKSVCPDCWDALASTFEQRRQEVYDAAMTGAIQKLDTMPRKTVESFAQCAGIVGAAAQSLLDYYRENDENLRLAAEARREFREAGR